MGDLPVAVIEGGQIYFIRTDHIGRPVFATNDLGVKVWEAAYLPFGGVHVAAGAPIDLRFPGQWFQAESGLHQSWMRDYDQSMPGSVFGESQCVSCWKVCTNQSYWPQSIPSVSGDAKTCSFRVE